MGGSYRLRKSRNAKFRAGYLKRPTRGLLYKVRSGSGKSLPKPRNTPFKRTSDSSDSYSPFKRRPVDLNTKRKRAVQQVNNNWRHANKVVQTLGGPLKYYQKWSAARIDAQGHSPFHNYVVGHKTRR